jgi:nucleoside 2-deoxyribosyltransferase
MKILVCGSIGYGGPEKIREIQGFLRSKGFEVIDQLSGMDYTGVRDFRDRRSLSSRIVKRDLRNIEESDVIIAVIDTPSYGTAFEMSFAREKNKKIISLCENEVPTPWPIYFSDYVVKSREELLAVLEEIRAR